MPDLIKMQVILCAGFEREFRYFIDHTQTLGLCKLKLMSDIIIVNINNDDDVFKRVAVLINIFISPSMEPISVRLFLRGINEC